MATEIRVPALGESVVEATVGQWFKRAGDTVFIAIWRRNNTSAYSIFFKQALLATHRQRR